MKTKKDTNFPFRPKDKSLMSWVRSEAQEQKRSITNFIEMVLSEKQKQQINKVS